METSKSVRIKRSQLAAGPPPPAAAPSTQVITVSQSFPSAAAPVAVPATPTLEAPVSVNNNGQLQLVDIFDLIAETLVDIRAVFILWFSLLLSSIQVNLYQFERGNGWNSVEPFTLSWHEYGIEHGFTDDEITNLICGGKLYYGTTYLYLNLYADDNNPNLAEDDRTKGVIGVLIAFMVINLCLTFGLRLYYALQIPFKHHSLQYSFQRDMYHASGLCRIQNQILFLFISILSILAIIVASSQVSQELKGAGATTTEKSLTQTDHRSAETKLSSSAMATFVAEFILAWIAFAEVLSLTTPVTAHLLESAPTEQIILPSPWYIPNEQFVEAILSLCLIPEYLLDDLRSQTNHPDFPHVNQKILASLTQDQLLAIKDIRRRCSGLLGRARLDIVDARVLAALSSYQKRYLKETPLKLKQRSSTSEAKDMETEGREEKKEAQYVVPDYGRFSPIVDLTLKVLHLFFNCREYLLFFIPYFSFVASAATLWALPSTQGNSNCLKVAQQREAAVKGAFYTFGVLAAIVVVSVKLWLDFSAVGNVPFASFDYLLNLEYRRKDPMNRFISACMLGFATLLCFMLIIIASSNQYAYPVSISSLVLAYLIMAYSGMKIFFHTSFVGMQHVAGNVPSVILPMRVWDDPQVFLNKLMVYAVLRDTELREIRAKTLRIIEAENKERSEQSCCQFVNHKMQSFLASFAKDPDRLYRPIALRVSGGDLVRIKTHLWAEYFDPTDEGFDRTKVHIENQRALRAASSKLLGTLKQENAFCCRGWDSTPAQPQGHLPLHSAPPPQTATPRASETPSAPPAEIIITV